MKTVSVKMRHPVEVSTFMGDEDEPEQSFVVDYGTHEGRIRVSRHIAWAVNNNRVVSVEAV